MRIFESGNEVSPIDIHSGSLYLLFLADMKERERLLLEYADPLLHVKTKLFPENASQQGYFQKFTEYCYFFLYLPESGALEIYLLENRLFFFHQNPAAVEELWKIITTDDENMGSSERTLFSFFQQLFIPELGILSDLEDKIEALEERVSSDLKAQFDQLWLIRKDILRRKRYYASASILLDSLEEYQDELFPNRSRSFHFISVQLERLNQTLVHLSDYISHVQDVCQAQADISLNRSMNFLTIVTAIFLPLTLLVGWYGMNFNMPEYKLSFSYPLIIICSILIIVLIIRYFKRKKWL